MDPGEEVLSEVGDDVFRPGVAAQSGGTAAGAGFTRSVPGERVGWGKGPMRVDKRKYKFDVNAALLRPTLPFSATKVDRMDAGDAGNLLHAIHQLFGIDKEPEERIYAFNQALWYEHAVNGGSTLQAERGVLMVDGMSFDIPIIVKKLGVDARRFFRAYADDIARCLRFVLGRYDPYEPETAEMYAAIMQVAVTRGLQKYPHLIHDSSDAGVELSIEERAALAVSKRYVISSTVNSADVLVGRVGQGAGYGTPAAVHDLSS